MGIFLTMAFLRAMRMTPKARVTVTTMGRPSGIAATAKETPMVNMSKSFLCWMSCRCHGRTCARRLQISRQHAFEITDGQPLA